MKLFANTFYVSGGFYGRHVLTCMKKNVILMFGSMCAQIDTLDDYNDYCHYTAGLMGLGLTRLFYTAEIELFTPDYLSNAMGLFLQVRLCSIFSSFVKFLKPFNLQGLFFTRIWFVELSLFFPSRLCSENKYHKRLPGECQFST